MSIRTAWTGLRTETPMIKRKRTSAQTRIAGIDSLRFFAALWVMISHQGAFPLSSGHDPQSKVAWALNGVYNGSFSGPAAVILFFLISGFCIHLPYAEGRPLHIAQFLVRRLVRISVPMIAAILLALWAGAAPSSNILIGIPAWSLFAELIYYGLYPWLHAVARQSGWFVLVAVAFGIAFMFCFTAPEGSLNYPAWGPWGDWIVGLPCWLMGVLLADRHKEWFSKRPQTLTIWALRGGAFCLSALTYNLKLQQILPEFWSLNFFAVFCYFWLGFEIAHYTSQRPVWLFERLGRASYSIYLMHITAAHVFVAAKLPHLGDGFNWLLATGFVVVVSLMFYAAVELPSHTLAKILGRSGPRPDSDAVLTYDSAGSPVLYFQSTSKPLPPWRFGAICGWLLAVGAYVLYLLLRPSPNATGLLMMPAWLTEWLNIHHDLRTLPMSWGYAVFPAVLLWDNARLRRWCLFIVIVILLAGEMAQVAVPTRSFTWLDVIFSILGALAAEATALAVHHFKRRHPRSLA